MSNESKIPWPIWAAVMLACAVIAAYASRPQTDYQRVEPRVSEPSPSQFPKLQTPDPSPPKSSPTAIPTSTPTITTEPTPNLSNPKWDYSVFNSGSVGDYAAFSYKMIEEPAFNQQNQQVEWIVEFSIPPEAEGSPALRDAYLKLELLQHGFRAEFIDSSGVFLGAKNLDKEGQGGYRRRYTLRVPNSIWEKWSKVAVVKVVRDW